MVQDRHANPLCCDNAQLLRGIDGMMVLHLGVWNSEFGTGQCMGLRPLASSQVAPDIFILIS